MIKNSVKFITLGCKVNQYETQAMKENLFDKGLKDISSSENACEFVVVNTCTVTGEADKNNRYWIRRARRENPDARIVVTGCYAEKNRDVIEDMKEVDMVLSNYDKDLISDALFQSCANPITSSKSKSTYAPLSIKKTADGRTRAFVKVQDGCNHACSFCKVVLVRGRSRSRDVIDVVEEVKRLADSGYREIVLAGIQLGAYGLDFGDLKYFRNPAEREHYYLIDIIEKISQINGIERVRLSSIEPIDIGDPLIETFASIPEFCPQMHIPLQSGDNEILERMNRRYTREFYRDLIAKLKSRIPDFELTLDVMVGFAGEEKHHFQNTVDLLEEIKPLKCHVFPYSSRDGTKAAEYENLPKSLIRERVSMMNSLQQVWAKETSLKYIDREMNVLVEQDVKGNLYEGLTDNYLRVCFQSQDDIRGQLKKVKLLAYEEGVFLGRPL